MFSKLLELYGEGSYLGKYSGDVVLSIIIIISMSFLITYLNVLTRLKALKKDFHNIRCDPSIVPFAGVIAAPEGESQAAYAGKNFEQCTRNVLEGVADEAFNPFELLMSGLIGIFDSIVGSIETTREFFDYLRTEITGAFDLIFGMIATALAPMVGLIKVVTDIASRLVSTLTITLYGFLGLSLEIQSLFRVIIEIAINTMLAMVVLMLAMFAIAWIPIIGTVAWGVATATGIVFALLLIPFAILMILMMILFDALGRESPQIPSFCFHPKTVVHLSDGSPVEMKDVVVGDKLDGHSTVTGTLILSNRDENGRERENLYEFVDIGTIVSGSHLVYDPDTTTFIRVKDAFLKDARIVKSSMTSETLVCLITSNHIVKIGKHIFHDWEDRN